MCAGNFYFASYFLYFFDWTGQDWPGMVFFKNPIPFFWTGWNQSKTQSCSCLVMHTCDVIGNFYFASYFLYFFIEWDKIDREWYFSKIPFRSFEQDGISQKFNLAHAWLCTHVMSSVIFILQAIFCIFYWTGQDWLGMVFFKNPIPFFWTGWDQSKT